MISPELLPPPRMSWMDVISLLPEGEREEFLAGLKEEEAVVGAGDWFLKLRREQIPPDVEKFIWLILAGRGFGKTLAGSYWLLERHQSGMSKQSAIIAATANDLVKYNLEGESGILTIAPPWFRPDWKKAYNTLVWPNGGMTYLYTSEKPSRIRGANLDTAWCDELSWWTYVERCWDNLMFTLRIGEPKVLITMTPRPIQIVKDLLVNPDCHVTTGSTYDNVKNLSQVFVEKVIKPYEGTRIGRQELEGEILLDVEGALWDWEMFERDGFRVSTDEADAIEFKKTVVAIDPATTDNKKSNETGIVVVSVDRFGHGYVRDDRTIKGSPEAWAKVAVRAAEEFGANYIVAEVNQGGDLVESVIRNADSSWVVKKVRASRGKETRAEPIVQLYEQGKVSHVGVFRELETQMAEFVPGSKEASPDRVDALVWGLTELMGGVKTGRARALGRGKKKAA